MRSYRKAASNSSGASHIIMWPTPGSTTVRAFGVAAARSLAGLGRRHHVAIAENEVAGTLTCAAAASAP